MKRYIQPLVNLSCISLVSVSSCMTANSSDRCQSDKTIELDQFTIVDMTGSGHAITDNPDVLGVVSAIEVLNDSVVAVCQNCADRHVVLYNTNANQSRTAMTRGEGPNEMLRVSTMASTPEGDLWLVGMMDGKVMKVHWNDDNNSPCVEPAFRLAEDYLRGVPDLKGGIIGLPAGLHSMRLYQTDASGLIIDSMSYYPNVKMPDDVSPSNFMFQSDMGLSPDASLIVLACKSWNYIDIVDTQTKQTLSLNLPVDEPIELDRHEIGQAVSYNPKPFWLMFSGVDVSDKSFYVGHIGVKVSSPDDMQKNVTSILEFDLSGNPLRRLIFGNEVQAFAVTNDGNKLYTVENAPDPILYEYILN